MPDLDFQVTDATPATHGMTPLLRFSLRVTNRTPGEAIQAVALNAQIQLQCPQRSYNAREKERLSELFGTPERWGETLRNRLWTHVNATVSAFSGSTEVMLPVPCTYDLNVSSAKYLHALEDGEVGLLFLFSGTMFYLNAEGLLQVQQISWNKECVYRMPVQRWQELMDHHYPNSAWLTLDRDHFERLYEYRRQHGLATWDQAIEQLLASTPAEVLA
jgi:hypothetical protein